MLSAKPNFPYLILHGQCHSSHLPGVEIAIPDGQTGHHHVSVSYCLHLDKLHRFVRNISTHLVDIKLFCDFIHDSVEVIQQCGHLVWRTGG